MVGGYCGYAPGILGNEEFNELPQGLYGSERARVVVDATGGRRRNLERGSRDDPEREQQEAGGEQSESVHRRTESNAAGAR